MQLFLLMQQSSKPLTHHLHISSKLPIFYYTFPKSRNISCTHLWTSEYIGNDYSNTYLCLFGRIHLDFCLLELLESSSFDSEDPFLSCSWLEILRKYSYNMDHIGLCLCVLPVHLFLSNNEMDKTIIFIFIDIILLDHIPCFHNFWNFDWQ